ncbi:hypothetical protein Tco_0162847, partial [Tanacetum coccineum]
MPVLRQHHLRHSMEKTANHLYVNPKPTMLTSCKRPGKELCQCKAKAFGIP